MLHSLGSNYKTARIAAALELSAGFFRLYQ
jgi:hypothetical protein